MSTREQILHILDSQLTQSNGRINGRLIRSSKYQYFRELVYSETNCLDDKDNITHRIMWIKLGYLMPPICKICGNRTRYQKQTQQFNTYCCPKCVQQDEEVQHKQKQTNLDRYGVPYGCIAPTAIEKQKQTCLSRHGVTKPFKSQLIQNKVRQVTIDRYGVNSTALLPNIKAKQIETRQQRYGVDFLFQSNAFQQFVKSKTKIKYDGLYPTQLHVPRSVWINLNDYDWLYDQYVIQNKSATQLADELNISGNTIINYLKQHEITIKRTYKYSHKCMLWLNNIMDQEGINIQHALNGGEYSIPDTNFKADGYCKETNTIYEFHGDYWHGNPNKFDYDVFNESTQCKMGELYDKTIRREQIIRSLGYIVITIWESEFK